MIAIIGILASLFLPGLSRARDKAHKVKCSSNLMQIGKAWIMYAGDHEGDVASNAWIGAPVMNQFWKWNPATAPFAKYLGASGGYLYPYLGGNKDVLVCPGSSFVQGLDAFYGITNNWWVNPYGPCTYQGFSANYNFTLRKIHKNYVYSGDGDKTLGWSESSPLPLFTDPVINMSAWLSAGNPRWDQDGMVVHGNTGTLPILMDDGHVMMFDRSPYPPVWGGHPFNANPLLGFKTQVDDILGLLP